MTKELVISLIQKYVSENGTIPRCDMTSHDIGFSPAVARRLFVNWNNAITAAGFHPRIKADRIKLHCNECELEITKTHSDYKKSQHHFCSQRCATIFNNRGTTQSSNTKQKISETLIRKGIRPPQKPKSPIETYNIVCGTCGVEFHPIRKTTKYCSTPCRSTAASIRMSKWLSENRAHVRGPHKQSYMEESFENWLHQHKVEQGLSGYLTEVYFFNTETGKNGWADFVFPRKRLIIELDGTHHLKRKHLDDIRDAHLNSRGWTVIRISHKQYTTQSMVPEIKRLLNII